MIEPGNGDRTRNHVVNLRNISKFTRNQWYKYMYKPSKLDLNSRCLIGITPLMGISREDSTRNFTPVPCRPAPEAANKPQCEPDQHGKGPTGLAVVFPPVNEQRCGKPRITVPETPWFLPWLFHIHLNFHQWPCNRNRFIGGTYIPFF